MMMMVVVVVIVVVRGKRNKAGEENKREMEERKICRDEDKRKNAIYEQFECSTMKKRERRICACFV